MAEKAETSGQREKENESKKSGPPPVAKAYLLLYNGLLTAGWFVVLYRTVLYSIDHAPSWRSDGIPTSVPGLYDDLRLPLRVFQTAACLEVVHVAVGIVRSALFTTFIQVFSRIFMLWGIVEGVAGTAYSPGLLLVAIAWSATEVIRYSFYFFALIDAIPYPIKWLRLSSLLLCLHLLRIAEPFSIKDTSLFFTQEQFLHAIHSVICLLSHWCRD
ncbi:Very-long-chain (3R)-3-hydroxyacyl-CoA dehydratase 2 [Geodia barretti]|uniref:Very-long-chain (3R)-3-hydroxyacyl-CoA dehydratase n=1 Tax=Geodia barretti TaxID=519541 RepID=A0AA35W2E9_GEOBA|nr:Very-long-chain (3R)-3-hydroxyacyl-CoA dehydratase 2 [Geodia barretti]